MYQMPSFPPAENIEGKQNTWLLHASIASSYTPLHIQPYNALSTSNKLASQDNLIGRIRLSSTYKDQSVHDAHDHAQGKASSDLVIGLAG